MKMEDIVRKQHELEDRIARFQEEINDFMKLAFCSLDTREHEIAIARLYDLMIAATDDATRIDHMFKGLLLKKTHSRRKSGERPSLFSRMATDTRVLEDFIRWNFHYPIPLTEQLAHDWVAGNADSTRRLLTEKNN